MTRRYLHKGLLFSMSTTGGDCPPHPLPLPSACPVVSDGHLPTPAPGGRGHRRAEVRRLSGHFPIEHAGWLQGPGWPSWLLPLTPGQWLIVELIRRRTLSHGQCLQHFQECLCAICYPSGQHCRRGSQETWSPFYRTSPIISETGVDQSGEKLFIISAKLMTRLYSSNILKCEKIDLNLALKFICWWVTKKEGWAKWTFTTKGRHSMRREAEYHEQHFWAAFCWWEWASCMHDLGK